MSPSTEPNSNKPDPPEGVGLDSAPAFSGGWVIGSMLAIGVIASVFAWLFQHYQTDETLAFWGSEAARQIRLGDRVELLVLTAADDPKSIEKLKGQGQAVGVAAKHDLTKAHGLTHARQAILQDVSYRFDSPPTDCSGPFTYALRFSSGQESTTLLLDLACPRVRHLAPGTEARLGERLAEGLKKFIGLHLEEKAKETPSATR